MTNLFKFNRAQILTLAISFTFIFAMIACAPFLDSPFSDQLLHPARNFNQKSIDSLSNIESDGKIRFALIADSHQNYKALDDAIQSINRTPNLDFVANLGDFTNSGYNLEYDQFVDSIEFLIYPMLTVIGNHDSIGAGPSLFKKLFGPLNFWFESSTQRFIFFHSSNLEDPKGFDPNWLKSAVDSSVKPVIIFTHAPLRDPERFASPDVVTIMDSVIANPKTQIVFNGHNHVYRQWTDSGTPMLQAGRVEDFKWLLIEIQGTSMSILRMDTGATTWLTLKN